MKKAIGRKLFGIGMAAVLLFGVAACGKGGEEPQNTVVTITPSELEQKIAEAVGEDGYFCDTEMEEEWLKNHYGLDLSYIEEYVAKQNAISSINMDTVIILKTQEEYAQEAERLLQKSYQQTVSYIKQYPFQTAKVMNARIYRKDAYVMLLLLGAEYEGEDTEEENKLAKEEYQKVDEVIREVFGELPENTAMASE